MAAPGLENAVSFAEVAVGRWRPLLLGVYVLVAMPYLIWRLDVSLAQNVWLLIVFFVIELYTVLTTVLHLVLTRRILHPVWRPPPSGRTVDAFIPTYNESPEIVEMTTIAAMGIRGIGKVFVLDDGDRGAIREMAARTGAVYVARGDNQHAKAGNMNHGLQRSDAEFVIFLDCDHVPQPHFIERTLGYFRDSRLAFVQTPQSFYNYQGSIQFRKLRFRNLWNEQTMFYEYIQPAKNAFNAAFFCGSGAILRRAALDSVGGFATGTATEDIHTSLRLHAQGWHSVFLSEVLAYGLAAEDFKEYHAQRVRWGAGSLGLLCRTMDSPLARRGLTPMQRLCYFSSINGYLYGGVIRLLYLVLPAVVLFAAPFADGASTDAAAWYLAAAVPFAMLSILMTYLYSRRTFHPLYTEQFNIANILACLMAVKGVVRVQKKFRVSVKEKRGKEYSPAYAFLLALAGITGAAELALVVHWGLATGGSFNEWPSAATMLALFWNTCNLAFVVSLVAYLGRFHRRPTREFPFAPPATPVTLASGEPGGLQGIGFQGAIVTANRLPDGSTLRFAIHAREQIIDLAGRVVDCQARHGQVRITVAFNGLSLAQKRRLVRFFFDEVVSEAFARDYDVERRPLGWRRSLGEAAALGPARAYAALARSRAFAGTVAARDALAWQLPRSWGAAHASWAIAAVTLVLALAMTAVLVPGPSVSVFYAWGLMTVVSFGVGAWRSAAWPRAWMVANHQGVSMEHNVTAPEPGRDDHRIPAVTPEAADDTVESLALAWPDGRDDSLSGLLASQHDEIARLRLLLEHQAIELDRVRRALLLAIDALPVSAAPVRREIRELVLDDGPPPVADLAPSAEDQPPAPATRRLPDRPAPASRLAALGWPQPRHKRQSAWRWR